jgi:uncharacterized membrane protein
MRNLARWALAMGLVFTGSAHFVVLERFLPLVPSWMPFPTAVVVVTGVMELALAGALVLAPDGLRSKVGWALATFLVVVFVGNVTQVVSGVDAFGLDTDAERWARLAFQPPLIALALWCTGAFGDARRAPSRV